jgi:hypothetical protein
MFLKTLQSIPAPDLMQPTATTLPTRQWVVEIGSPALLANNAVTAAPNSMQNPLKI